MKDENKAIIVNKLTKVFKLPHEQSRSIKSHIVNPFKNKTFEEQLVLEDISFSIDKGEFFGIVGRNGSGKSTLLKLLAGIYTPTSGDVKVIGKLTPFIELGVGFNDELTGKENVYLNGALFGFTRNEVAEMYDEIVEFAELEKFMDQKLKNYSSGMQVRLAFSIAIRAQSDILVLDEVLAVGDEAFQKKCFSYFEQLKAEKRTIVLVTHDMAIVEKFCSKALLISEGRIIFSGDSFTVAEKYRELNSRSIEDGIDRNNVAVAKKIEDTKGVFLNLPKGSMYQYGDKLNLSVAWDKKAVKGVENIGAALFKTSGEYIFGTNTIIDKKNVKGSKISVDYSLLLGEGEYYFKVGLFGKTDKEVIRFIDKGPKFTIRSKENWQGIVKLSHQWIDDGKDT